MIGTDHLFGPKREARPRRCAERARRVALTKIGYKWLERVEWNGSRELSGTAAIGRRIISGIVHVLKAGCRWRDCPADAAYDSDRFRGYFIERGTKPIIPNNPTRKRLHPFDRRGYRARNLIEPMFCRFKNWRRIATRYDKLATTFLSAIFLAAALICSS